VVARTISGFSRLPGCDAAKRMVGRKQMALVAAGCPRMIADKVHSGYGIHYSA
jgi:hypothetical protein